VNLDEDLNVDPNLELDGDVEVDAIIDLDLDPGPRSSTRISATPARQGARSTVASRSTSPCNVKVS
jgi:hypothetical protein